MSELAGVSSSYGIKVQGFQGVQRPEAKAPGKPKAAVDGLGLTPEEERVVAALKAIDAKVRAHEAAHQAAGAGLTGGATFTYTRGPDGKQYAVGGEVAIDTGPVPGNPRATLAKAQQIQAAALAPADPSSQDRAVAAAAASMAAAAASMAAAAQQELNRQRGPYGADGNGGPASEGAKGLRLDLFA